MTKLKCYGCEIGHDSLEAVIACESAQQTAVRAELDAAAAKLPKRDGRFLARNARGIPARRKTRK